MRPLSRKYDNIMIMVKKLMNVVIELMQMVISLMPMVIELNMLESLSISNQNILLMVIGLMNGVNGMIRMVIELITLTILSILTQIKKLWMMKRLRMRKKNLDHLSTSVNTALVELSA